MPDQFLQYNNVMIKMIRFKIIQYFRAIKIHPYSNRDYNPSIDVYILCIIKFVFQNVP